MTRTPPGGRDADGERNNTRLYAGVLAVEAVVLVAIWLFQRYFGS
jgi:hypothetical protein